jgi:hypothetical protein
MHLFSKVAMHQLCRISRKCPIDTEGWKWERMASSTVRQMSPRKKLSAQMLDGVSKYKQIMLRQLSDHVQFRVQSLC